MKLQIAWKNELILYVLQGHAEFQKAPEIANGLIKEFKDHLEPVLAEIGKDKLFTRVHEQVKKLSPNSKKFPEQYRSEFNRLRLEWQESAKDIPGYHRTSRLQTLQELLDQTMLEPLGERYTQGMKVQAIIKIISEMRQEGDKAQIQIAAEDAPQQTAQDQISEYYKLMTPEQIKEIEDADAAGEPVAPIFSRIVNDIRLGNNAVGLGSASGDATPDGVEPRENAPPRGVAT